MTRVQTPVKNWSGVFAGDVFINGVCEQAKDSNLAYYRRHGYIISAPAGLQEEEPSPDGEQPEPPPIPRPDDDAKKAEWVAYAHARGINPDGMTIAEIATATAI